MPLVEIEVGVEIVGYFKSSLLQVGKRAAMREQFGFERAPASLRLGIIVGVAQPAKAGQRLGFCDTCPARQAGTHSALKAGVYFLRVSG